MKLSLTKIRNYELEPYGRFLIKWKTRQGHLPNIIPMDELRIKHDTSMPMSDEQLKQVIKVMKKGKTDILTDGRDFYTRLNNDLVEVYHKKLGLYRDDLNFKSSVDNGDKFANVILNNIN
jgi:hypothetical protein